MGRGRLGGEGDVGYWRGEAARLSVENTQLRRRLGEVGDRACALAEENTALRCQVAEFEEKVRALTEKVSTLARLAFGTSSEKKEAAKRGHDGLDGLEEPEGGGQPEESEEPGKPEEPEEAEEPAGGPARRGRGQQRASTGHGRRDYSHLPSRQVVHDLEEAERVCPDCGTAYVAFGQESCEQIDWQVRLVRVVHVRPTYRRSCGCPVHGVLAAPPPAKVIPKGRFGVGFYARLLVEKFVLGRPTHRIVAALGFEGLELAEGTLAGVYAQLSVLLAPLAAAIAERNAAGAHLHVDETSWRVYEAVDGKDSHRWWCWVFVGADTTVFRIEASRSLAVLRSHLGIGTGDDEAEARLPQGRELLLSSDFFAVYQSIGGLDGVDNLWCWAHIRRYFIRAGDAHPALRAWAAAWCERIAALYVAHTAIGAAPVGSRERAFATAQFAAALNGIDAERKAQAAAPGLHPAAAKVLATLDREWAGLARHQKYTELPLDNNTAERALRTPVVGRKNYYGSGSKVSAELASRVWTITATAARAGYNPLTYLTDYLGACARAGGKAPTGQDLDRFLPWAADQTDAQAWRAGNTPGPHGAAPAGTGAHGPDRPDGPAP